MYDVAPVTSCGQQLRLVSHRMLSRSVFQGSPFHIQNATRQPLGTCFHPTCSDDRSSSNNQWRVGVRWGLRKWKRNCHAGDSHPDGKDTMESSTSVFWMGSYAGKRGGLCLPRRSVNPWSSLIESVTSRTSTVMAHSLARGPAR